MNIQKSIIGEELLSEYNFYIWGIMYELRAADGLDRNKLKLAFELLDEMKIIYEDKNQIDKVVLESLITIPGEMVGVSQWDILEGNEIKAASNKLFEYRKSILEDYKRDEFTIIDKDLLNDFRENSIGENGFLNLLYKYNICDNEKIDNTFLSLEKIIEICKEITIIDIEVGYILMLLYESIVGSELLDNNEILIIASSKLQTYLRQLLEVEE
ncbi:hypothetical protein [Clostridium saccharoperbutylacetonicum]|uniref:hypothetical protein n=1 Tax=Clostridium saccharoperbutylacetonicum TaxID=36745 RepID=UPI0039EA9372